MERWYVRSTERSAEEGPLDADAILDALDGGGLSPETLIRRADETRWVRLKDDLFFASRKPSRRISNSSLKPVEGTLAALRSSNASRPFSWRRACVHAAITPASLFAFVTALERSGAVATQLAMHKLVLQQLVFTFVVGLGVSFLYQKSRRRVLRYLCASPLLVAAVLSVGTFATIAWWVRAPKSGSSLRAAPDPWQYRSDEHAFTVTLPSSAWRKVAGTDGFVQFQRVTLGPAMRMVITHVQAMTRGEFDASIPELKRTIDDLGTVASDPRVEQGTTAAGAPYVFISAADEKERYFAVSETWLKQRAICVRVVVQGMHRATSQLGRALESSVFEEAAGVISKSVTAIDRPRGPATDAAASFTAPLFVPREPAKGPAAHPLASFPPPRFDWKPGCRVPIFTATKGPPGISSATFVVSVEPAEHDNLHIRQKDGKYRDVDGQEVTAPEWQERLKPMVAIESIPFFDVTSRGAYLKAEGHDLTVQRVSEELHLDGQQAAMFRRVMNVEGLREATHGLWLAWAEAWLDWRVPLGKSREFTELRLLPTGERATLVVRERATDLQDGYAALERTEILQDRLQRTFYIETPPRALRPRLTRFETQTRLTYANAPRTKETNTDYAFEQQWDWSHAQGCSD